jgi:hypothetical protein
MRQLIILQGVAGADFSWAPNQLVELDDVLAAYWADGVRARYLEPGDFVLQHHTLTANEVEELKTRFLEARERPLAVLAGDPVTPAYVFDILNAWATGQPLDFDNHPVPEDIQARIAEIGPRGVPVDEDLVDEHDVAGGEPVDQHERDTSEEEPMPQQQPDVERPGPGTSRAGQAIETTEAAPPVEQAARRTRRTSKR